MLTIRKIAHSISFFLFFLLIYSAFSITSCNNIIYSDKSPSVIKGFMDLSAWDFDRSGTVRLDGEWEFYWNKLLTPQDFISNTNHEPIIYLNVPSIWNGLIFNGKKLDGKGYASYKLIIHTGQTNAYFGLNIPALATSYKLYINGRLACSNGNVSDDSKLYRAQYLPQVVYFYTIQSNIELILQVANFNHFKGGFWDSVRIGRQSQIQSDRDRTLGFELFLSGSLFIMGLYHLVLFFLRRTDKSPLYFSIFTLLIALRTFLDGSRIIIMIYPMLDWELHVKMSFLSYVFAVPVFLYFIHEIYQTNISKLIAKIVKYIAFAFSFFILFFKNPFYDSFLLPYEVITIFVGCFIIYQLIIGFKSKFRESAILIAGFIIFFITTINDILYSNQIIYTGTIVPFGFFVMILSQSVLLSTRFSLAYNRIETLTNNLKTLNENLETKVKERTQELTETYNKLHVRNEVIEADLALARKIQMKLIPSKSPAPNIASFYKPMDKIGGDFFDFIVFREPDHVGIFLSDVSGHGVSAAFITSMIKTAILQIASQNEKPSILLKYLNSILYNQTGGNFVTAFYGIFDSKTNKLLFSNAGHNQPYLINDDKIEYLPTMKKGYPLALINNEELKQQHKLYTDESFTLKKRSKILFYTDGLTEAVNIMNKEDNKYASDFESSVMSNIMLELKDMPSSLFIKGIYEQLVQFRGADNFDDDVCMICLST